MEVPASLAGRRIRPADYLSMEVAGLSPAAVSSVLVKKNAPANRPVAMATASEFRCFSRGGISARRRRDRRRARRRVAGAAAPGHRGGGGHDDTATAMAATTAAACCLLLIEALGGSTITMK